MTESMSQRRAGHGFTLIELLIVVAIVAILTVTAIASYEFAMVKARTSAAKGCLTDHAQYMERYYTAKMTYKNAAKPTCSDDVTPFYTIRYLNDEEPTDSTYTLEIVPQGRQAEADGKCGTMTIDQTGKKTATKDGCWK